MPQFALVKRGPEVEELKAGRALVLLQRWGRSAWKGKRVQNPGRVCHKALGKGREGGQLWVVEVWDGGAGLWLFSQFPALSEGVEHRSPSSTAARPDGLWRGSGGAGGWGGAYGRVACHVTLVTVVARVITLL